MPGPKSKDMMKYLKETMTGKKSWMEANKALAGAPDPENNPKGKKAPKETKFKAPASKRNAGPKGRGY